MAPSAGDSVGDNFEPGTDEDRIAVAGASDLCLYEAGSSQGSAAVGGDNLSPLTAADPLTVRKWGKTDRNEHYAAYIQSASFAGVKEAFAVAPEIQRVGLIVVRRADSEDRHDRLEVLWATSVTRDEEAPPPPHDLPELEVTTKGRTREVIAHDLEAYPELDDLIDEISSQLQDSQEQA